MAVADLGEDADLSVSEVPLPPVAAPAKPLPHNTGGKVPSAAKRGAVCGYFESSAHRVPFAWRCVVKSGLSVLRFPIRIEWPNCPRCYQPVGREVAAVAVPAEPNGMSAAVRDQVAKPPPAF